MNQALESLVKKTASRSHIGVRIAILGTVLLGALIPPSSFASNLPGDFDSSFGTSGFTTATSGTNDSNLALAIDGSGRIVAGGYATISGASAFNVTRYLSSGALDTSCLLYTSPSPRD